MRVERAEQQRGEENSARFWEKKICEILRALQPPSPDIAPFSQWEESDFDFCHRRYLGSMSAMESSWLESQQNNTVCVQYHKTQFICFFHQDTLCSCGGIILELNSHAGSESFY